MRCPECEQRNSVAAKECGSCGVRLKQKQLSVANKLAAVGAVLLAGTLVYGASQVPRLADPLENLAGVAKHLAAGPKSTDEARKMKADFEAALKNVLVKVGADNSQLIAKKLQAVLPSSAFEVHVIDLPKGLKLVEIDTILQAADFLVMKGSSDVRVFPLPGFEVFDDARAVSDQAGPVLVLLGHSSGQMPHRPLLRTYALLPDFIEDETEKMVPSIKGEGTAKFVKDSNDVNVELTLQSMAQAEKVQFNPPLSSDSIVRQTLRWKDARYVPDFQLARESNSYLVVLVHCLRHPEQAAFCANIIGATASRMVKEQGGEGLGDLTAQRTKDARKALFLISSKAKDLNIELKRNSDNNLIVASYKAIVKQSPAQTSVASSVAPVKIDVAAEVKPEEQPIAVVAQPVAAPVVVATPQTSNVQAPLATEQVSASTVRLRKGPSLKSRTLDEIPLGAKIQILSKEKDWYKVNYAGNTGYAFAELVDRPDPNKAAPEIKPEIKPEVKVAEINPAPKVTASKTNPVVSSSEVSATITRPWSLRDENRRELDRARVGESVTLLSGLSNHKYKIRLANGSIGWLDKDALNIKGNVPVSSPKNNSGKSRSKAHSSKAAKLEMPEFVP